jgi:hypothetical protein
MVVFGRERAFRWGEWVDVVKAAKG